jgi:ribosome recycling factor
MIKEIIKDAGIRMGKSIESLKQALVKVRTGRAHPSLLDHLVVDYYGSDVPISQVANINVEDARTLMISPWEKQMVQATAGTVIRIPMPPLTEETRRDLVKVVRHDGEAAKVAIRNIRRDANSDFKSLLKEKDISEDEERDAEGEVQQLTDKYVSEVDKVLAEKEKDLMEV